MLKSIPVAAFNLQYLLIISRSET